jgi:hypothetical protein
VHAEKGSIWATKPLRIEISAAIADRHPGMLCAESMVAGCGLLSEARIAGVMGFLSRWTSTMEDNLISFVVFLIGALLTVIVFNLYLAI